MKEGKKMKKKEDLFEKFYPIIFAIIITILYKVFLMSEYLPQNFDKIIDASIYFSTIIIGFLGVLIAIIFSIRNSEIMKFILSNKGREFKYYFKCTLISGVVWIFDGAMLYIRTDLPVISKYKIHISYYVLLLWVLLMVYFVASSFRIIDIMIEILFKDPNPSIKTPRSEKLDDEKTKELKKKLNKNFKDSSESKKHYAKLSDLKKNNNKDN